jgi:D-aminoacyl-tRNA deacylase
MGAVVGEIRLGLLIFLGCQLGDSSAQGQHLAARIAKLRVFEDLDGRTNLDIFAVKGEILLVSQFTLAADLRRGNRPSFTTALAPLEAQVLLSEFSQELSSKGLKVENGVFGAHMEVSSCNMGPATYLLEA